MQAGRRDSVEALRTCPEYKEKNFRAAILPCRRCHARRRTTRGRLPSSRRSGETQEKRCALRRMSWRASWRSGSSPRCRQVGALTCEGVPQAVGQTGCIVAHVKVATAAWDLHHSSSSSERSSNGSVEAWPFHSNAGKIVALHRSDADMTFLSAVAAAVSEADPGCTVLLTADDGGCLWLCQHAESCAISLARW